MGLVELGQHAGLSPALLSKIERGKMFPTLPTLLRVALVFSVGLDHFFGGGRKRPALAVVRASIACRSRIAPGPVSRHTASSASTTPPPNGC